MNLLFEDGTAPRVNKHSRVMQVCHVANTVEWSSALFIVHPWTCVNRVYMETTWE